MFNCVVYISRVFVIVLSFTFRAGVYVVGVGGGVYCGHYLLYHLRYVHVHALARVRLSELSLDESPRRRLLSPRGDAVRGRPVRVGDVAVSVVTATAVVPQRGQVF